MFAQVSFPALLAICLGICVGLSAIGLATGYAAERYWRRRGRKIFDLPMKRRQLRHEMIGTAMFHVLFAPALAGALHFGLLRFESGWTAQILGFLVPWYGFQVYYYLAHRAMHSRALFWMHKWHHVSMVTSPMTGLSMHPAEAVVWIVGMLGPAIVLSQLGLLGFGGSCIFLSVHWTGNIIGHANAELVPTPSTYFPSFVTSSPISYHALHHARFDGHYGFAVATMDRLFGTEFADWLAVHQRVFGGQPMTSIKH